MTTKGRKHFIMVDTFNHPFAILVTPAEWPKREGTK